MSLIEDTLAIVVLYKKNIKDSKTLHALSKTLKFYNKDTILDVYVYDNSPKKQIVCFIDNLKIHYQHNPKNPGVSRAYNEGVEYATSLKKEWVFLLDDDTEISKNYFQVLSASINNEVNCYVPVLKDSGKIISPCYFFMTLGYKIHEINYGVLTFGRHSFLNSGTFIKISSFLSINGYRDEIPLYFSDFDFVERLKKKEKHFYILETVFNHSLSFIDDSNYEAFLPTFERYCDGLKQFLKSNPRYIIPGLFFGFLRVIKKTIKHNSLKFFKIFKDVFLTRL